MEGVAPVAAEYGSEVTLNAPAGSIIVDMDDRRIDRILRNLILNALEHGEGRPVNISVAANDTAVAVAVRDHGIGMTAAEAARVFDRFWRADPARARTTGGSGLGLSIAAEDTKLHNGWLQAWGSKGSGSNFRLTLPLRQGETITKSPLQLEPVDVGLPGAGSAADHAAAGPLAGAPRRRRGPGRRPAEPAPAQPAAGTTDADTAEPERRSGHERCPTEGPARRRGRAAGGAAVPADLLRPDPALRARWARARTRARETPTTPPCSSRPRRAPGPARKP